MRIDNKDLILHFHSFHSDMTGLLKKLSKTEFTNNAIIFHKRQFKVLQEQRRKRWHRSVFNFKHYLVKSLKCRSAFFEGGFTSR